MSADDGIIHSFQQRRQLEAAITSLASEPTEAALIEAAHRIVQSYPSETVLPTLLRHLGTSSSQLRGGLGHLCTLLPADATNAALRAIVGNRQKSAQERTTAALILERYLHEPVPAALLIDLAGSDDVPYQSLLEAVDESRRNRHVLLEYITQMEEHPVDTAFMVLGLIDRLPPIDAAELLRLIAQDTRPQVARSAIDRLALRAAEENGAAALRALHTLHFTLKADQAAIVERSLRKLQFGGRRYRAPAPMGWRALLSPTDAGGYLSIWFVREPSTQSANDGTLLGFVLSLNGGVLQFSAAESMERAFLPAEHTIGALVSVQINGNQNSVLLEAPFDAGRWLLTKALEAPSQPEEAEALRGEYTLYNDLLWQFDAPALPADLQTWWDRSGASDVQTIDPIAVAQAAQILVEDPAMEGWVRWATSIWENVRRGAHAGNEAPPPALIGALLRELGRTPDHRVLLNAMNSGLRVQTLWYAISGSPANAARCALLAVAALRQPIAENSLLAGLLEVGLARQPSPRRN